MTEPRVPDVWNPDRYWRLGKLDRVNDPETGGPDRPIMVPGAKPKRHLEGSPPAPVRSSLSSSDSGTGDRVSARTIKRAAQRAHSDHVARLKRDIERLSIDAELVPDGKPRELLRRRIAALRWQVAATS